MILNDAGLGDTIEIPAHWPSRVTVEGWRWADVRRGDYSHLSWEAPGVKGTTLLSDATVVTLVAEADPEVRERMHAETEAALEALLATMEDEQS